MSRLRMPVMNGDDLARRLKQVSSSTRLIALTGYGQESDRQRSKHAGFDEHAVKPLGIAELKKLLERARPGGA